MHVTLYAHGPLTKRQRKKVAKLLHGGFTVTVTRSRLTA
jgi:hypothetical protein